MTWHDNTNSERRGPIHSGENFDRAIKAGLVDPKVVSAGTMMKRMGRTDEVAKMMAFLMSDDASYITGGRFFHSGILELALGTDFGQLISQWMVGHLLLEEERTEREFVK